MKDAELTKQLIASVRNRTAAAIYNHFKSKRLTQNDLADLLGISRSMFTKVLSQYRKQEM